MIVSSNTLPFQPLSFYFFIILQLRVPFYCSYVRLLFCPQFLILSNILLCHFVIIFFVSLLFCCLIFNPFNCGKTLICCHPERLECFLPFHSWYWPLKMWDRCQLIKSNTSSCIKNNLFQGHLDYLHHIKILFKWYGTRKRKKQRNMNSLIFPLVDYNLSLFYQLTNHQLFECPWRLRWRPDCHGHQLSLVLLPWPLRHLALFHWYFLKYKRYRSNGGMSHGN